MKRTDTDNPELDEAINCIRMLKKRNEYKGSRIGRLKILPQLRTDLTHEVGDMEVPLWFASVRASEFSYQVGDTVLFTEDEHGTITIERPWRERQIQTSRAGSTSRAGAGTIRHSPRDCVEEYDITDIPKGLYELHYGIGRTILDSIDCLAANGHREAAFLLLLNVIAGLSRRRFPVPETKEGLVDKRKYNRQRNEGTTKGDPEAFIAFVDDELLKLQKAHPEYGLDFNDVSFCTLDSSCRSVGEWIYNYFRCVLVHNTKTSSTYRLDMNSDALVSQYFDLDGNENRKSLAFGYYRALRMIVANAEENDESF